MGYDPGTVRIYSNDGSQLLWTCDSGGAIVPYTVTSTGVNGAGEYVYEGSETFLGLAKTIDATVPDFPVGTTFTPETEVGHNAVLYIVTTSGGAEQ